MDDITVVIVEYHSADQIGRALAALRPAMAGLSWNVVIVSNSQYDEPERSAMRRRFADVEWIFNDENVGFGRAVNQAIAHSASSFLLLLNPDAQILAGRVSELVEFLRRRPDVAAAGPRLVGEDGCLEDSARRFLTPFSAALRSARRLAQASARPITEHTGTREPVEVDWVSGACMMARRDAIDAAGPLDPFYFMYVEDMDWCKRFWDAGLSVIYW